MTDHEEQRPVGSPNPLNFDSLLKIVNLLVIIGAVFMGWQKSDSRGVFTDSQVAELRTDLKDQNAQIQALREKMATLETQVANLTETLRQDERFRSAVKDGR